MNNRVGSSCWYRRFDDNKWSGWCTGRLLAWSTDYQELENGVGNYPVGIIEDYATMCCFSIIVTQICFAAVPPGPIEEQRSSDSWTYGDEY